MPAQKFLVKASNILLLFLFFFVVHIIIALLFREFSVLTPLKHDYYHSLWSEPLLLLLIYLLLFIISARHVFSLSFTVFFYLALLLMNAEKVANLQIPVFPSDLIYMKQLFYNDYSIKNILVVFFIFLTVSITLFLIYVKSKPSQIIKKHQQVLWLFLITIVITFIFSKSQISEWLTSKNIRLVKASPLSVAQRNGFLTFFVKRLVDYQSPPRPATYNKENIVRIINKYKKPGIKSDKIHKPNVIVILVEAFTDPLDVGFKTTFDPIPNFRQYGNIQLSGKLQVPVIGGRSANSEFELLTGMSMRFIPRGSIPYIDVVNREMPSIAREFKMADYDTEAIHVASLNFFNYELVYPLLGFDHHSTLMGKQVEMDPANRYPSEQALVKEIIAKTNKTKPQFIFAFPNSTHGFWGYDNYLDSDLDAVNWPFDIQKNDIKTYINALHSADKAFGELIKHYEKNNEKTVILIAGDHMPGLLSYRFFKLVNEFNPGLLNHLTIDSTKEMRDIYNSFEHADPENFHLLLHQVPYLVWTNFQTTELNSNTSMNLVHDDLFSLANISPSPLYQLTKILKYEIGEVSKLIPNAKNNYQFNMPDEFQEMLGDYELLQYDILYGQNHYYDLVHN